MTDISELQQKLNSFLIQVSKLPEKGDSPRAKSIKEELEEIRLDLNNRIVKINARIQEESRRLQEEGITEGEDHFHPFEPIPSMDILKY